MNKFQKDSMQDRKMQVLIDKWASSEEVQAVEEAFRQAGLEAKVQASVIELSEQFTWIVIVSMRFYPNTLQPQALTLGAPPSVYRIG
ncbi:MAG: hypothetical protein ACXVB5_21745 [Isosphaeraceae bacterium]